MDKFKSYNIYVLVALLLLAAVLFSLALFMRPVEGNLTRLGGYLSNNFNVNDERKVFKEPLYKLAKKIDDYDRYYDVVVIGDSFSRNLKNGWQNFLVNKTDISLITFDIQKISPSEILSSPMFHKMPPRVFIYESIEYAIWLRNSYCPARNLSEINSNEMVVQPVLVSPILASLVNLPPSKQSYQEAKLDFDAAANYMYKSLFRNILNFNVTKVRDYQLMSNDLFSNKNSSTILFHYKNFDKSKITDKNIEISTCSLLNLQDAVQANKKTSFLFFPVPDKLSAYSHVLQDKSFKELSIIHKFEGNDLNMLRVDRYISDKVSAGVVDLYLPDDTHWSYKGYDMASIAVCEYLLNKGVFLHANKHKKTKLCSVSVQ